MTNPNNEPAESVSSSGKMTTAIQRMDALYRELVCEIEFLAKAHKDRSTGTTQFLDPATLSGFERRTLVRSIFSFVEALSYSVKGLAMESNNAINLSIGERLLALEEAYELSEKGEVKKRPPKLKTIPNVQFAFKLLADVEGSDWTLDTSSKGWQSLLRTSKVRDRLMHPKTLSDLTVSDNETRDAWDSFTWFQEQINNALKVIAQSLEKQLGSFKAQGSAAMDFP